MKSLEVFLALSIFFSINVEAIDVNANFKNYTGELNIPNFETSDLKKDDIKGIIESSVLGEYSIKSLENIGDEINGEKWKSQVTEYRKIIAQDLKIEVNDDASLSMTSKDRVMVFISESVPISTLRNYARDLEKIGGVFVMRGMIGGLKAIRPQALFSAEVLRMNKSCKKNCTFRNTEILIDPIMFKKYGISKVPAIVVQSGLDIFDYCHTTSDFRIESNVIYGDSSISYAMEMLSEFDGRVSIKKFQNILK